MKLVLKRIYLATIAISSLSFAACNNNGAPPAKFTIGGTVVNLAGTAGGLTLQDNLQNNLTVNSNGTFRFATPVASNTAYSVTISTRPSNPAQTCGVANGSGTATANITNIRLNCGRNEWAWMKGPNTVSGTAVYGTIGVPSAAGTGLLDDMWKYSNGEWTWMFGSKLINQAGIYGTQSMLFPGNIPGARTEMASWLDTNGNLWLFGGYGVYSSSSESDLSDLWMCMP
jgi:hypothetical protein